MLIPISKQLENNAGAASYNLYDVDNKEVSNWTIREIKEAIKAGRDIKGFAGLNSKGLVSLRLNSYFLNIGSIGEKTDSKDHYTVVKRKTYKNLTIFMMVDCVGKDYELPKDSLIKLIKNGAVVSGVKLVKDSELRVCRDIKIEVSK